MKKFLLLILALGLAVPYASAVTEEQVGKALTVASGIALGVAVAKAYEENSPAYKALSGSLLGTNFLFNNDWISACGIGLATLCGCAGVKFLLNDTVSRENRCVYALAALVPASVIAYKSVKSLCQPKAAGSFPQFLPEEAFVPTEQSLADAPGDNIE